MGYVFSSLLNHWQSIFGQEELRLLILGLDNAGKTTLLYRMHLDDVVETTPTIGFNLEVVKHGNLTFQVWDLGGQESIRPYWRCYYQQCSALIFVVDAADKARFDTVRAELDVLLKERDLKTLPLVVMANKMDMTDAATAVELSGTLGLSDIVDRQWTVVETSARTGQGVNTGLDWLTKKFEVK